METRIRIAMLVVLVAVVSACAALLPTVKNAEVAIEKHGAAFEACSVGVVKDAVIASANVVLQAEHAGLPVEIAARMLQSIAAKEAESLKVCAAGGTPDKLWIPPTDTSTPDAGPPAPPPGTTHI